MATDLTDVQLVVMKMTLEYGVAPAGTSLPDVDDPADPLPLLVVTQCASGEQLLFHHPSVDPDRFKCAHLSNGFGAQKTATGTVGRRLTVRWYVAETAPDGVDRDVRVVDGRQVIMIGGVAAAVAYSDRENDEAAEVEILTLPEYRRQGFGKRVTAAWIAATLRAGKVPFYSHLGENAASRRVAESLGLRHFCDEVEYYA